MGWEDRLWLGKKDLTVRDKVARGGRIHFFAESIFDGALRIPVYLGGSLESEIETAVRQSHGILDHGDAEQLVVSPINRLPAGRSELANLA